MTGTASYFDLRRPDFAKMMCGDASGRNSVVAKNNINISWVRIQSPPKMYIWSVSFPSYGVSVYIYIFGLRVVLGGLALLRTWLELSSVWPPDVSSCHIGLKSYPKKTQIQKQQQIKSLGGYVCMCEVDMQKGPHANLVRLISRGSLALMSPLLFRTVNLGYDNKMFIAERKPAARNSVRFLSGRTWLGNSVCVVLANRTRSWLHS